MESTRRSIIFSSALAVLLGWGLLSAVSSSASIVFNATPSKVVASVADAVPVTAPQAQLAVDDAPGLAGAFNALTAAVVQAFVQTPSPSPAPVTAATESITVIMGGDVMFDRRVRLLGDLNGYESLLSAVAPLFKSADIATVNLEGPITSYASRTLLPNEKTTSDMSFTFDPSAAATLADANVTAVSLANNHVDNFGRAGYTETTKWLSNAGVQYFGNSWNDAGTELTMTKNGIKLAFVGYHAFMPGFEKIVADVKRLKAAGYTVIVMPHWGVEYSNGSTADQHAKARSLVSAGADAVIGAHPHVVEDHEWISGVPVFYSLGNLLFDQYFQPEVMKGNIVALHISKNDSGTHVNSVDVYETSTASKTTVTVGTLPTYSESAPF